MTFWSGCAAVIALVMRSQCVKVGDHDLRAFDVLEHVLRNQLAVRVVAVGIVRLEYAEPVANCDSRRDKEEPAREAATLRTADRVDCLPCDDHGHDSRLASASRELERQAIEAGLEEVRRALAPRTRVDWMNIFYQYTNRLAHLYFLRTRRHHFRTRRSLVLSPIIPIGAVSSRAKRGICTC